MSSFLRHIDASNNGRAGVLNKWLLTPDDCAVAFIDHQPQMLLMASNFDSPTDHQQHGRSCQGDAHLRRAGPVKYGRIEGHQRLRHKSMIQASRLHTKE